jgi:hypothetical protein
MTARLREHGGEEATTEGILEAVKDDYGRLLEANAESLGLREDGDRKRSA